MGSPRHTIWVSLPDKNLNLNSLLVSGDKPNDIVSPGGSDGGEISS